MNLVGAKKLTNFQGLGRGGGLAVRILGSASRNRISIMGCNFSHNQALAGGGLDIKIADQANSNSVEIVGCDFVNSTGDQTGGGISIELRLASIQNNVDRF